MQDMQKFGKANNKIFKGILIERDLKFDKYVLSQHIKAGKKLSAFIAQRMNIMKVFTESQLGYFPLV